MLIKLKRRMAVGGPPATGDLAIGEIAIDFVTGIIYGKNAGGTIIKLSSAPATGDLKMSASANAQAGWLNCDGAAVSRTTYLDLFNEIGTVWGVGDGSTTFNLPDLRGRVPLGVGTGSGLTARALAGLIGVEEVTLSAAQSGVPAHTHTGNADSGGAHTHSFELITDDQQSGTADVSGTPDREGAAGGSTSSDGAHVHTVTINANAAAAAASAHTNMQPSAGVYFLIKT